MKMEEKQYYIYILASKKYGTLYTGVTSNLVQRILATQEGLLKDSPKSIMFIIWFIMKFILMSAKQ